MNGKLDVDPYSTDTQKRFTGKKSASNEDVEEEVQGDFMINRTPTESQPN